MIAYSEPWYIQKPVQTQYRDMDKGCEEILWQRKNLCNSSRLRTVVAIYKINKLFLSKKYISLKSKGSEKTLTYSKSSFSRPTFCKRLIKLSLLQVSLWAMINTKESTLTASSRISVVELNIGSVQIFPPLLYKPVKKSLSLRIQKVSIICGPLRGPYH